MTPIDFLLTGDPSIRWQTMRDLLGASESDWRAEQSKIVSEGWGVQMMAARLPDGSWPNQRWTAAVWTLPQLIEMGFPQSDPRLSGALDMVAGKYMPLGEPVDSMFLLKNMDLCHLGFWLRIGSYFVPKDGRLPEVAKTLLGARLADGGWNCRLRMKPNTTHSSFHTTFNVLEGLREAAAAGILGQAEFDEAEAGAVEFMLRHRMFKSDKTGQVVNDRFLQLTFPSYWHYTVLRGLDYVAGTQSCTDERLKDALDWLQSRRKSNGLWSVEKRIPGVVLFDMERQGSDSRWNTLRALRVLDRCGRTPSPSSQ